MRSAPQRQAPADIRWLADTGIGSLADAGSDLTVGVGERGNHARINVHVSRFAGLSFATIEETSFVPA